MKQLLLKIKTSRSQPNENNYIHIYSFFLVSLNILKSQRINELQSQPEPTIIEQTQSVEVGCTIDNDFLFKAINNERSKKGLKLLTVSKELSQSAQAKAEDHNDRGYWSHNTPEGVRPFQFITDAGYKYKHAGENLARDWQCDEQVIVAWMQSPTHKDNILGSSYKEIGIGRAGTYIVTHFGVR